MNHIGEAEPHLRRAVELDPSLWRAWNGLGIVATLGPAAGTEIVGSAMFRLGSEPGSCEFATTVLADYGGQGLGGGLMTALIQAAKRRGLTEMEGYVLAQNRPMLNLAKRLGFSVSRKVMDPVAFLFKPTIVSTVVVLPAPFGPIGVTSSPLLT